MAHECYIYNEQGRLPTPDECRKCAEYKDSSVYSEDNSRKYWDMLNDWCKENEGKQVEKTMQSDQIAHLFNSISIRAKLLNPIMGAAQALGQPIDLVGTIQTAYAIGWMLATKGLPEGEALTWDMLAGIKGGTVGEIETFLSKLNQLEGDNEGTIDNKDNDTSDSEDNN